MGNFESKNGQWKGDKVGYTALHDWVYTRLVKPCTCSLCGEIKKVEICNISGNYTRDLDDWEWLCRKCHMTKDGRLEKFNKLLHTSYIPNEEVKEKIRVALRNGKNVKCNLCGKEFYRKKSKIRLINYCGQECRIIEMIRVNKKGKRI